MRMRVCPCSHRSCTGAPDIIHAGSVLHLLEEARVEQFVSVVFALLASGGVFIGQVRIPCVSLSVCVCARAPVHLMCSHWIQTVANSVPTNVPSLRGPPRVPLSLADYVSVSRCNLLRAYTTQEAGLRFLHSPTSLSELFTKTGFTNLGIAWREGREPQVFHLLSLTLLSLSLLVLLARSIV